MRSRRNPVKVVRNGATVTVATAAAVVAAIAATVALAVGAAVVVVGQMAGPAACRKDDAGNDRDKTAVAKFMEYTPSRTTPRVAVSTSPS